MGLDMYLEKKTYVKNWDHETKANKYVITVKQGDATEPLIKPERISYITEEVMYWRKANAIHSWFIRNCADNVDDCQPVDVYEAKINELSEIIDELLNSRDQELAATLLPPQSGFFFGSTERDEWYWKDLEQTKEALDKLKADYQYVHDLYAKAKATEDFDGPIPSFDIIYQASW